MDINDQMSSRPLDAVIIEGYATYWNMINRKRETFERGMFSQSLHLSQHAHGVFMLRQHDESTWPIGKWTTIKEDDRGLWVRGALYPKACDPVFLSDVKSQKIRELSVGIYPTAIRRTLRGKLVTQAWLTEISLGQNAMLPGTTFRVVEG